MKEVNIHKLADLINKAIKEGLMKYDIQNPNYQHLYLEIFFDDLQNGEPSTYESFREKLIQLIDVHEKRSEACVESFMTVWNAWTALYHALQQRGRIVSTGSLV